MTSMWTTVLAVVLVVGLVPMAKAAGEDGLQDFCVADLASKQTVNGLPCKPAAKVTVHDFKFAGLKNAGNTNNVNNAFVTPATVFQFPGLNTLGVSAVRVDYGKGGLNPPHTHPRANELLILLQGSLYVGFVGGAPTNTLYATTIHAGEAFVFPKGLVHFQLNVGQKPALAYAALNSQNPGVQLIAAALFTPDIKDEVLTKAFRVDTKTIDTIQAKFRV